MVEALRGNYRFRMAVKICRELGIDDPIHWMNNTDPRLLDLWIADFIVEAEDGTKNRSPETVLGGVIESHLPKKLPA